VLLSKGKSHCVAEFQPPCSIATVLARGKAETRTDRLEDFSGLSIDIVDRALVCWTAEADFSGMFATFASISVSLLVFISVCGVIR
jgi:hypothetical protein